MTPEVISPLGLYPRGNRPAAAGPRTQGACPDRHGERPRSCWCASRCSSCTSTPRSPRSPSPPSARACAPGGGRTVGARRVRARPGHRPVPRSATGRQGRGSLGATGGAAGPRQAGVDVPGQALFIVGMAGLTYALAEGNAASRGPGIVAAFALAAAALGGFAAWEARCAHPMLPAALLRIPVATAACAVNFRPVGGGQSGDAGHDDRRGAAGGGRASRPRLGRADTTSGVVNTFRQAGAVFGAASVYGTLRPRVAEQARGLPGR